MALLYQRLVEAFGEEVEFLRSIIVSCRSIVRCIDYLTLTYIGPSEIAGRVRPEVTMIVTMTDG